MDCGGASLAKQHCRASCSHAGHHNHARRHVAARRTRRAPRARAAFAFPPPCLPGASAPLAEHHQLILTEPKRQRSGMRISPSAPAAAVRNEARFGRRQRAEIDALLSPRAERGAAEAGGRCAGAAPAAACSRRCRVPRSRPAAHDSEEARLGCRAAPKRGAAGASSCPAPRHRRFCLSTTTSFPHFSTQPNLNSIIMAVRR